MVGRISKNPLCGLDRQEERSSGWKSPQHRRSETLVQRSDTWKNEFENVTCKASLPANHGSRVCHRYGPRVSPIIFPRSKVQETIDNLLHMNCKLYYNYHLLEWSEPSFCWMSMIMRKNDGFLGESIVWIWTRDLMTSNGKMATHSDMPPSPPQTIVRTAPTQWTAVHDIYHTSNSTQEPPASPWDNHSQPSIHTQLFEFSHLLFPLKTFREDLIMVHNLQPGLGYGSTRLSSERCNGTMPHNDCQACRHWLSPRMSQHF